jgi:hypothetical protein
MAQLGEAIARYHRLIENENYKDLAWVESLRERMHEERLTLAGRPICPVLRPHFITRRQYTSLVKAGECLFGAINRVKQLALSNAALLNRMELLPAEKMLASVDPGYPYLAVTSLLDTQLHNGSLQFTEYNADTPTGVAYGDALSEMFYDAPPVKEFRKRYSLTKLGGTKHLLQALLKAWKEFGGKHKPRIAIVEFRQQFQSSESDEYLLLREYFQRAGYQTEVISPDQLEYRDRVLRKGDFTIDLIYRRVKVEEFLVRFDLSHPLVRAYRERAACVVNSFRSELAHKKAIFDLLTDETITASFPAAEKRAIRDFIPWTRVVAPRKTTYDGETVDLPEFIVANREKLLLKPNDESGENQSFHGWEMDDSAWERAVRTAMRQPYVVQERVESCVETFPVYNYGALEMRSMRVDLHPHAYLGKIQGCSSWVTASDASAFTSMAGIAPTFMLEPR